MTKMKVGRESDQYLVAHELSKFTSSTATNVVVGKVREVVGDCIGGSGSGIATTHFSFLSAVVVVVVLFLFLPVHVLYRRQRHGDDDDLYLL